DRAAQAYKDRVAGMTDLGAPMDEARRMADDPKAGTGDAFLAGTAGGANTVMQTAFAPLAPVMALPGVHQLASLGAIPGQVGKAVARGVPVQAGGRVHRVLPWDAGEAGGAAVESATNVAALKLAPAAEAATMKAVGKTPVGAAVASAARYDQGAGPVGRAAAALTERMRGPQTAAPVAQLPPAVAAPTVPAWKPPVAPPEGAAAPDALYKPPMRYEGTRAPALDIQPIREVPRPAGAPGVAEFKAERVVNEPRPGDVPVQRFMGRKAMAEAEAELARRAAQDNPLTPVERKIQDASGGYSPDVVVTEPGMVDTPVRKPPEIGIRRIGRTPPPPAPPAPPRPTEPPPPPTPPQEVARFRGSDARAQADRMAASHRPDPLMAEQPLEVVPGDVGEWIVRKPGHEEAPAIERPDRTYEPPAPRSAEVVGTFRGASARANAQAAADAINAKRPSGGLVHEPEVEVVPGSDVGSWEVRRPGDAAAPTPVRRIGRTPPPVERPASPEPAVIEPVKETVPQGAAEKPRQVPEADKVPAEVVAPQEAPAAAPKPVAGKPKVPPITKAKPAAEPAPETIEASDIGKVIAENSKRDAETARERHAQRVEIAREAIAKGGGVKVVKQRMISEIADRGHAAADDGELVAAINEARKPTEPAAASINQPSTSAEPTPAETPFERRMREAEEGREGGETPTKPREGPTLGSLGGALGPASPTKALGALDKAWDLTVGRVVDAVSERVKKSAPFVRRVRQAFVNEELTLDPSEQLHQTKQRLGKGGGVEKHEARLTEKLAKSIDKELRRVPEADAAEGYRYLGGETDTLPATITPKAKSALDAASAAMHVRRVAMQVRGIISEAVLKEYPRFVSRIMRLKENGKRTIGGSGTVSKIAREVHRMDAPGVLFDHGEKAVADLVAKLGTKTRVVTGTKSRTLVKFDTPEARDSFIESARKEFGHRRGSTGWRDSFDALSETDRALLHEITDPADSFAITMARANAKIAAYDFLGELQKIGGGKAENGGDWVVDLAPGDKPPPGYTKVEGHQWGPLNGKALSPDIHEYATSLTVKPPISAIGEVFREGFRSWKIARTVESWPTVVRNWLSHDYMTTQAGVSLMNPENWGFHAKAIKALAGRDAATLKWAVENGIVGNDWYATLNKERIGSALNGSETPVKTLYRWFTENPEGDLARANDLNVSAARALGDAIPRPDTLVPGMKTVRKAASHLYSMQEDLVRLPAALKLQEAGKSIHAIIEELEATTP
ncbi:MAG: hypothetical protein IT452_02990, partial [Planctomycetia bacterium]|nr:hypothetical protein [Planctomycetia bacterium]